MKSASTNSTTQISNQHVAQPDNHQNVSATPSAYKRAYKACEQCRKTKAKCELAPAAAACSKCIREQKECVFPPYRSTKRAKISAEQSSARNEPNQHVSNTANSHSGEGVSSATLDTTLQTPTRPSRRHGSIGTTRLLPNASALHGADSGSISREPHPQQISAAQDSEGQPISQMPLSSLDTATDLQRDVMQTFVTSSKDAIGLLFRAAEHIDSEDSDEQTGEQDANGSAVAASIYNIQSPSMPSPGIASTETLDLWDQHRFVRQGWFTAREAVTYLEFFFRNLSPLSPVADAYYADHKNHKSLILGEPLLCCTLLTIASRHYNPASSSLGSRADFIHMRLWKHVEHLIQRITFGSEKYSVGKTRTLGSIQALLLIIEWHPRALHFPPENDGWDASLAPGIDDAYRPLSRRSDAGRRWREDVFEPAKRSDRMSWMLIGIATTLAHELGVFDHLEDDSKPMEPPSKRKIVLRTRRLLYLYASQLSLRLGCTTVFPSINHQAIAYIPEQSASPHEQPNQDREIMVSKWIEITKLLTTATEMFFASPSATRSMLRSSRYVSLLDHFQPLLTRWHTDFTSMTYQTVAEPARQILLIEYQYVRMYINSIAMQALVERASSYNSGDIWLDQDFLRSEFAQDFRFVKEVRDSSASILAIATKLAENEILQYCPVRLFLRIVSASIFLLKTISLGSRESDIVNSLGELERCIQALQSSRADDIHLSSRYAMLIARHVRRFKRNFRIKKPGASSAVTMPMSETATAPEISAPDRNDLETNTGGEQESQSQQQITAGLTNDGFDDRQLMYADKFGAPFFNIDDDGTMQDWLAQPFNSQVAPFGTDWLQPASGLAIDSLDFLWNMST